MNWRIIQIGSVMQTGARGSVSSGDDPPPSGFVPTDIPNMTLGLTSQLTGSPVSTWGDDSSYSHDVNQADSSRQPLVGSIVSGKPSPVFDGTNDYMDGPNSANVLGANGEFHIIGVFRLAFVSDGEGAFYSDAAITTGADGWWAVSISPSHMRFGYNDSGGDHEVSYATNYVDNNLHCFHAAISGSSIFFRVDNQAAQTAAISNYRTLTDAIRIGGEWALTKFVSGTMNLWYFSGSIEASQLSNMYTYIAEQYPGVTVP